MEEVRLAKKKTHKNLKRKREIQKRWCCHQNVQSCQDFHPYKEQIVKVKVAPPSIITQQPKQTWKDWLKRFVFFWRI